MSPEEIRRRVAERPETTLNDAIAWAAYCALSETPPLERPAVLLAFAEETGVEAHAPCRPCRGSPPGVSYLRRAAPGGVRGRGTRPLCIERGEERDSKPHRAGGVFHAPRRPPTGPLRRHTALLARVNAHRRRRRRPRRALLKSVGVREGSAEIRAPPHGEASYPTSRPSQVRREPHCGDRAPTRLVRIDGCYLVERTGTFPPKSGRRPGVRLDRRLDPIDREP